MAPNTTGHRANRPSAHRRPVEAAADFADQALQSRRRLRLQGLSGRRDRRRHRPAQARLRHRPPRQAESQPRRKLRGLSGGDRFPRLEVGRRRPCRLALAPRRVRGYGLARKTESLMEIREGLTFDDVLLEPGPSDVMPTQADTATRFTRADQTSTFRWSRRPWTRSPRAVWPSPWPRRAAWASCTATSRPRSRPTRCARSSATRAAW